MYGTFVIKDEKNLNFGTPLFFRTVEDLRRALALAIRRDPTLAFGCFPSDFSVWFVGDWNEMTGEMALVQDKEHVCSMLEIVGIAREMDSAQKAVNGQEVKK